MSARPTAHQRKAWTLVALVIAVLFAVIAVAATAELIIREGVEKCPAQFPKWIGCALAIHETMSGSLITIAGALLAAWIAWHAVMHQIESDKELARNAERPIVHGGPGMREILRDAAGLIHKHTGIVFTAQNSGRTPAFTKEIYWGVCTETEWRTLGKEWPHVETANHREWEEVLPPQMKPSEIYAVEFTRTPIPDDGENRVCYGKIMYTDVYGRKYMTGWKHMVVHDGDLLKTWALPGGYSSEWEGQ